MFSTILKLFQYILKEVYGLADFAGLRVDDMYI